MKKNSIKRIFCLYPVWLNNSGHEASYLECFKFLSRKTSNKLFIILPKKNTNKFTNVSYAKILEHISTGYISLIYKIIYNFRNLNNFFSKKKLVKKDTIFIDGYSFDFLISLALFFFFKKKEGNFLIYCRYNFKSIKKIIFNLLISLISSKFSNYKILTDTKSLSNKLSKKFGKNRVLLVPVPHTVLVSKKDKKLSFNRYDIFFPGQYRYEKFGKNFFNFIKLNDDKNYRFLINKHFKWNRKRNFNLKLLNSELSHKNYLNFIKNSQLIILPYDRDLYKYRTSGIFIESIVFGKPVLVTEGTWMATEYKKFNLNEMIVKDWSKYKLKTNLQNIFNKKTKKKISNIRNKYKEFHNKYKYTDILQKSL